MLIDGKLVCQFISPFSAHLNCFRNFYRLELQRECLVLVFFYKIFPQECK